MIIANPDYTILFILTVTFLCLVAFSAQRQLHRPLLVYGGFCLACLLPIFLPIYIGIVFFKAKNTRLFVFLLFLSICLIFLNLSISGLSRNIEFSDLYKGKVTLEEGDDISIRGEFFKLHEDQYIVSKAYSIGGSQETSYYFYYEIVTTDSDSSQKIRIFVVDVEIFDRKLIPIKNLLNRGQFNAYVFYLKNVDNDVLERIRNTLEPEQELIFIAEHSESTYKSNQNTAIILTSIFMLFSLIFIILAFRAFVNSRKQITSN